MSSNQHRSANRIAGSFIGLSMILGSFMVSPAPASAGQFASVHPVTACTQAAAAGNWGYTYTGWLILKTGMLPVAAVGHVTQDTAGHVVGSQTRSVAGAVAEEAIQGTVVVYSDCTASFRARVYVGGKLQRTGDIDIVYTNSENNIREIFEDLVNPDGSHIPTVITANANRL